VVVSWLLLMDARLDTVGFYHTIFMPGSCSLTVLGWRACSESRIK
jgi:hypothetical protein